VFTRELKNFTINFGPQHPAAHGVLRLILELEGEVVKNEDAHIGLLHRGTEKLTGYKNLIQGLSYFDRLDYVSMTSQEHGFCIAIEKLNSIKVSRRDQIIRVIFLELTRILNHLLRISRNSMDAGVVILFLWASKRHGKLLIRFSVFCFFLCAYGFLGSIDASCESGDHLNVVIVTDASTIGECKTAATSHASEGTSAEEVGNFRICSKCGRGQKIYPWYYAVLESTLRTTTTIIIPYSLCLALLLTIYFR